MASSTNLVNATAFQRLAAKALDALPSAVLLLAVTWLFSLVGGDDARILGMTTGAVLAGGYALWLWIWEAGSGKTPGNLALGIRTTSGNGHAPGLVPVLLRNALLGVSGVVVVGPVVLLVSNLWDKNHQRQGWHDKVAGTLVVDVRAGRDPLLTGGIRSADASGSTLAVPPTTTPAGSAAAPVTAVPGFPSSAVPQTASSPFQTVPAAVAGAPAAPAGAPVPAPVSPRRAAAAALTAGALPAPVPAPAPAAAAAPADVPQHPDDELEMTRVASRHRSTGVLVQFDDGAAVVVTGTALLGRNPATKPQETVGQLLDFADMGRSVSKTHLHLQADPNGVWVTDRNSTNGSAVVTAQGLREELEPLRPVLAPAGSTVFFGDRSFTVSRA
ncbi:RDD family protein [Arthrobacter sp. zg-Y1116]|uniref:RDD family protein n=1 Tax=Arthrobacter sp. zg-Y1116 TaxID=2964611 RepID=UPI002103913C|nr:RDD family protein [Arthrobacter sp. zg-Y1116]MCQ1947904.1 RDD family protein [Arthrobacter sp. zg-Y1116]